MEDRFIEAICNQIYRKFPEVDGVRPKIQSQELPESSPNYLLTFKGSATTANGKRMSRIVRVVATEKGKIVKVTTSR